MAGLVLKRRAPECLGPLLPSPPSDRAANTTISLSCMSLTNSQIHGCSAQNVGDDIVPRSIKDGRTERHPASATNKEDVPNPIHA